MDDRALAGIPILVCGNKTDKGNHMQEREIIEGLNLDYVFCNNWAVVMTSAKTGANVNEVLEWLVRVSKEE